MLVGMLVLCCGYGLWVLCVCGLWLCVWLLCVQLCCVVCVWSCCVVCMAVWCCRYARVVLCVWSCCFVCVCVRFVFCCVKGMGMLCSVRVVCMIVLSCGYGRAVLCVYGRRVLGVSWCCVVGMVVMCCGVWSRCLVGMVVQCCVSLRVPRLGTRFGRVEPISQPTSQPTNQAKSRPADSKKKQLANNRRNLSIPVFNLQGAPATQPRLKVTGASHSATLKSDWGPATQPPTHS